MLLSLAAALFGVAFAIRDDDDKRAALPGARPPGEQRAPAPLVTEIRRRSPVGRFQAARCRNESYSVEDPERWFHPTDNFYSPGRKAPTRADLDHLALNDGAVVVTYRRDTPAPARDALQRWAAGGIGVVVAPSDSRGSPRLEAYTSERRLICDGVDLDQLTTFTDRHFSRPIPYTPHGKSSE